jgi:hypothetical protein
MMKNTLKVALLGLACVSYASATEIRSPWVAERGPLRYTFEKADKDSYSLNFWSATNMKEAHKAFAKHSFETKPLSQLIFNKSDFEIQEAFPNAKMAAGYDDFNPLVGLKQLNPRVQYTEVGMNLGGEVAFHVYDKKGRVGVRANVPFRKVEMSRLDNGLDQAENPTSDFVQSRLVSVDVNADDEFVPPAEKVQVVAKAYNLKAVAALYDADAVPLTVGGRKQNGEGSFTIFGNELADGTTQAALTGTDSTGNPQHYAYKMTNDAEEEHGRDNNFGNEDFLHIPASNLSSGLSANELADFASNTNYTDLLDSPSFDKNAGNYWLIFRRQTNAGQNNPFKFGSGIRDKAGDLGQTLQTNIDALLQTYDVNAFYFLAGHGYHMDSQIRTGLGDINAEVFYAHDLTENLEAEVRAIMRAPTGGDNNLYGSPYSAMLGNGGHFELGLGGMLAWAPLSWMNLKFDAAYNFALQAKEHRMATFKGSKIKNMGPRADADVSWSYGTARVDATVFHAKTRDIRTVFGYEFYYKAADSVKYKSAQSASWLGAVTLSEAAIAARVRTGQPALAETFAVDNKLAAANTESISHKARFETSYQVHKYFEFYAGGSMAFAGQNVMQDKDAHCGFNVRF